MTAGRWTPNTATLGRAERPSASDLELALVDD
jgi:hypothetical protein